MDANFADVMAVTLKINQTNKSNGKIIRQIEIRLKKNSNQKNKILNLKLVTLILKK